MDTHGKHLFLRFDNGLTIHACPRCPTERIRVRGQWDENRMTYWCPLCQT